MNYTNAEKEQHIKELQEYLLTISLYDKRVPSVTPNGVYDKETANAVAAFRQANNIPSTGAVDENTWYKIYESYTIASEHLKEPSAVRFFRNGVPAAGDAGTDVAVLQAMLNEIGNGYANIPFINLNGVYDDKTETAVKNIQRALGIYPDGKADMFLVNEIISLFNAST